MTAEQYFKEHLSGEPLTQESVIEGLKEFAKFHVQAALEASLNNSKIMYTDTFTSNPPSEVVDDDYFISKESILNAYPLNLIQ